MSAHTLYEGFGVDTGGVGEEGALMKRRQFFAAIAGLFVAGKSVRIRVVGRTHRRLLVSMSQQLLFETPLTQMTNAQLKEWGELCESKKPRIR